MTAAQFHDAPAVLLRLDIARDVVLCQTYSADRRPYTNIPPKRLAPENLPVLLYQLVLDGYTLQKTNDHPLEILCMSGDFLKARVAELEAQS